MNTALLSPTTADLVPAAVEPSLAATDPLFAVLYNDLHRLARRELARQGGHLTMGATTLLHEAYLGMSARAGTVFPDNARFMAYAARAMRGLIVDYARRRYAQKRGGQVQFTSLETTVADRLADVADVQELERISDALDGLAEVDPSLAEVVELKFFCGLSFAEIAAMRGVSERTVQRQWEKARLYLYHQIGGSSPA